jgi:tetratricopeptide (TPR) repeat protein
VLQKVARTALDNKLYLEAMNLYEKLYEAQPDDIAILRILGYFYYQVKLYERGIPIYQTILEREPDSPSSLFEMKILALSLKNAGRPGEAAEVYEQIIEREPENLQNYYNLAFMYIDLGDYRKGQDAIKRGLEQDPTYVCLYYSWGKLYENQGKSADEGERFDEAVSLFGNAKEKFQRCAGSGAFCSSTCQKEIERMDALVDRTAKRKQKKLMESPSPGEAQPVSTGNK